MVTPTCVVEGRCRSRGIFVSYLGGRMDRLTMVAFCGVSEVSGMIPWFSC